MTNSEQSLQKIEGFYNEIARDWAVEFADEHKNKPEDQELLQRFAREVSSEKKVIDLGCGIGNTSSFLYKLGVNVSGLDLSEGMVTEAKRLHPEIEFHTGNILDLDFNENSIGGAVIFYAIVHFSKSQVAKTFSEIYRVLQPGGRLLLTYHVGDKNLKIDEFLGHRVEMEFSLFTSEFIAEAAKKAGFTEIEVIEREPHQGVEYQSRRAYLFAGKPIL